MLAPSLLPLLLHSRGTPAQGMVPLAAGRSSYLNEQNQINSSQAYSEAHLTGGCRFRQIDN